MANIQPAKKSYYFGPGYIELINIIKAAWKNNIESAKEFFMKISDSWNTGGEYARWFKSLFYIFATLSMFVFGSVFCIGFSLLHVTLLLAFMCMVYISFTVMWIIDTLYLMYHKVFIACPKCKEKYTYPIYLCPKCGAEHSKLVPGVYGILKRTCECGEKLPTTFFNGRKTLDAKCPICTSHLATKESVPICIPIIGGPSAGKTCYISAIMKELIENVAPENQATIEFYDHRNEIECKNMIDTLNNGEVLRKTMDNNPSAYNFFIKNKDLTPDRLMYIYDIAGEAFSTQDALSTQKHYEYCHGIIIIVDPFSVPNIREKFEENTDFSSYKASIVDINDTFDAFIMNLKRISGLNSSQLSKVPCSIVVNKIDAYMFEQVVGYDAAITLCNDPTNKIKNIDEAMDFLTKQFLTNNGMNNFVRNIETCFTNYRYFSCSSLGHTSDGSSFKPKRVMEPLAWLVGNFDKRLQKYIMPKNTTN